MSSEHKLREAIEAVEKCAAERECGECQACCEVIGVRELGKPYRCKCVHQCPTGCAIYSSRPKSCGNFLCWWKLFKDMRLDWRPDRSGVLIEQDQDGDHLNIWETRPSAFNEMDPNLLAYIVRLNVPLFFFEYGFNRGTRYPIAPDYPQGSYGIMQPCYKVEGIPVWCSNQTLWDTLFVKWCDR